MRPDEKPSQLRLRGNQLLDVQPQRGIVAALLVEIRRTLRRVGDVECRQKNGSFAHGLESALDGEAASGSRVASQISLGLSFRSKVATTAASPPWVVRDKVAPSPTLVAIRRLSGLKAIDVTGALCPFSV